MKPLTTLIMLFPVLLFGQDISLVTITPTESSQTHAPGDISAGDNGLPVEVTRSVKSAAMVMGSCEPIVLEADATTGLVGANDCPGVSNGMTLLAFSTGMSAVSSVGPGAPIAAAPPVLQQMSITRFVDENSGRFLQLLLSGETISFFELSTITQGANEVQTAIIRMEDCIVTSISSGGSGGEDRLTENVTIAFTRACYRYFNLDINGAQDGYTDACVDLSVIDQSGCACDPF